MNRNFDRDGASADRSAREALRNEKIRSLGLVCYNLYVDGNIKFPEITVAAERVHLELMKSEDAQSRDEKLSERLSELGCTCYNLYVDKKLFNSAVLELCDSIAGINGELAGKKAATAKGRPTNGSTGGGTDKDGGTAKTATHAFHIETGGETVNFPDGDVSGEASGTVDNVFRVTVPYGMEPIPINCKRCRCGYRNRSYAYYCARCGAKL